MLRSLLFARSSCAKSFVFNKKKNQTFTCVRESEIAERNSGVVDSYRLLMKLKFIKTVATRFAAYSSEIMFETLQLRNHFEYFHYLY